MKNRNQLIILLHFFTLSLFSQEFQFPIIAESNGNLDTIIIGFDAMASIELDSQFNEIDISNEPFDPVFEVRVGQIEINDLDCDANIALYSPDLITYMSKVDIVPKSCVDNPVNPNPSGLDPISSLFFRSQDLPIVLRWDATVLQNDCLRGSLMTDWHPGGWFDAGCGELAVSPFSMESVDSVLITQQSGIYVVDSFGDTLTMIHVALVDKVMVSTRELLNQSITIYPNPTNGLLHIESDQIRISSVEVYNTTSQLVIASQNAENINLSTLPSGVYFLSIKTADGILTKRVIKEAVRN